ncbi:hypothetical protein BDC45DRAFT_541027 [Circinella umbellata]|nr:hypothetical protein BDC45DRAFT_541027 [Circinella umbellata]
MLLRSELNHHNYTKQLVYIAYNTRHRLLLSTPNTPPLVRHGPWNSEVQRSLLNPPRNEEIWLPNRRRVRGDRLERSGPRDNLFLLAQEQAEQAEQDAERALQLATFEQDRRSPQLQRENAFLETVEYPSSINTIHSNNNNTNNNNHSTTTMTLPYQPQQQRTTTIAITPHLENFITDATYVPSVNISSSSSSTSSGSEDEQFVLQLPVRDARLASQSVAEWAGSEKSTKQRYAGLKRSFSDCLEDDEDDDNYLSAPENRTTTTTTTTTTCLQHRLKPVDDLKWKNTQKNVERMDDMYNTTFSTWIQAEENALTTANYMKRLTNEYPLERLIHVIKWIITDWRLQSISTLIKNVISNWDYENNVARMLREITEGWEQMECVTSLVADVMAFRDDPDHIKAALLKSLSKNWDFSRLSAFLMRLDNNIDHKIKCELLHRAAQTEQRKIELRMSIKRRRTRLQ